jgi:hypothetical protein
MTKLKKRSFADEFALAAVRGYAVAGALILIFIAARLFGWG